MGIIEILLSPQIVGGLIVLRLRGLFIRPVLIKGGLETSHISDLLVDRGLGGCCLGFDTVQRRLLLVQLCVIVARINLDQQVSLLHQLVVLHKN